MDPTEALSNNLVFTGRGAYHDYHLWRQSFGTSCPKTPCKYVTEADRSLVQVSQTCQRLRAVPRSVKEDTAHSGGWGKAALIVDKYAVDSSKKDIHLPTSERDTGERWTRLYQLLC